MKWKIGRRIFRRFLTTCRTEGWWGLYIFILHSKFQANAEELRERERLVEMQSEELVAAYQSCRKLQKKIAAVREELRMVLQHEFRFDIQPSMLRNERIVLETP